MTFVCVKQHIQMIHCYLRNLCDKEGSPKLYDCFVVMVRHRQILTLCKSWKPDEASLSHKEWVWPLLLMFAIFCSPVLQIKVVEIHCCSFDTILWQLIKLIPATTVLDSFPNHLTKASPATIISSLSYPRKMISHSCQHWFNLIPGDTSVIGSPSCVLLVVLWLGVEH